MPVTKEETDNFNNVIVVSK
jgi:hypothetical protein